MMNPGELGHCAEDVVAVERLTAGQAFHGRWEGIVGALLYPGRPASPETLRLYAAEILPRLRARFS